ncbi:hypothetical protein DB346_14660 [Verrucomicrobia bacterium LW23]|nr:hypothetical protein DB346_14660 [Verrucomicrobia bacterium LW23]
MLTSSPASTAADSVAADIPAAAAAVPNAGSGGALRHTARRRWRPRTAWILTLRPSLFFAVLGATLVLIAFQLDDWVFAHLYKNNPLYPDTTASDAEIAANTLHRDHLMELVSLYGDWWGLMVGCALVLAVTCTVRFPRWRTVARVVAAMMLTSTLAGAASNGVRLISCRARPTSQVEPGFYPLYNGKERAIFRHAYSSFPSGHAATAAGLFTLALILNWRLGLLMFAVPLIVSWSRLYFGVHHLSDVVASQVVAFFVAAWVWTYAMPWLRARYTLWWCGRKPLQAQRLPSG